MGTDKRVISLRDVLVKGLRDIAVQIASLDMSSNEPTAEQVTQYVQALQFELDKACARGVVVPPSVAVYADPRMLAAANREALSCLRLRLADGTEVLFTPPPAAYVMGSIGEEIERAAGEATPTQEIPAYVPTEADKQDERENRTTADDVVRANDLGPCPQCQTEPPKRPDSSLYVEAQERQAKALGRIADVLEWVKQVSRP